MTNNANKTHVPLEQRCKNVVKAWEDLEHYDGIGTHHALKRAEKALVPDVRWPKNDASLRLASEVLNAIEKKPRELSRITQQVLMLYCMSVGMVWGAFSGARYGVMKTTLIGVLTYVAYFLLYIAYAKWKRR